MLNSFLARSYLETIELPLLILFVCLLCVLAISLFTSARRSKEFTFPGPISSVTHSLALSLTKGVILNKQSEYFERPPPIDHAWAEETERQLFNLRVTRLLFALIAMFAFLLAAGGGVWGALSISDRSCSTNIDCSFIPAKYLADLLKAGGYSGSILLFAVFGWATQNTRFYLHKSYYWLHIVAYDKGRSPSIGPDMPTVTESESTGEIVSSEFKAKTYGQILKSSLLIGGSSTLNIAIGLVRTKAMAIILGPSGFGLLGMYNSISELACSLSGMGINSSGVRQIAEAAGSDDVIRVSKTAIVLRRTSIFLGLLGASILLLLSNDIAFLTFGSAQYGDSVAMLACVVLFNTLAGAQGALIQGMRRIGDLAKLGFIGAIFGAVASIPIVYVFREDGVATSLVCVAMLNLLASWWFRRKINLQPVTVSPTELRGEQLALLKLGFALMTSSLMMTGTAYVVRILIVREVGVDAAGLFQSAWALGGFYVGLILQSMGTDFYPRLVGVAQDNQECNRLVNEQAQVSLLLAGPGVIATLTFAPLIILFFYSAKFVEAVEVLRWISLGIGLRVITWPMGFIIVAKSEQTILVAAEIAWTAVNLGLTWVCIDSFGLNGAGIAFFGSYVFHGLMIYPIVRRLSGFRWSAESRQIGFLFLLSISIVFCGFAFLPLMAAYTVGGIVMILSGFHSLSVLITLVSSDRVPRSVLKLLNVFRRGARGSTLVL